MKRRRLTRTLALAWLACAVLTGHGLMESMPVVEDELLPIASIEDESAIREAQQYLIDMGMLSGEADGKMGPMTEAALKAFQAKQGLSETGALDTATLAALKKASPISAKRVQQRLIDLGYLRGTADGLWGSRSAAALRLFQRLHGLETDGDVDEADAVRLFSDSAIALPGTLEPGDKGDAVTALQQRLIQFGFMSGAADGAYGKKTVAAVKAFQQHLVDQGLAQPYDIEVNGIAGAATQWLLFKDSYSTFVRTLKPGDTDGEVQRVEQRLWALGYMDMAADETLDDYALEALKRFRQDAELLDDSIVDQPVIDALFSADAPTTDHPVPHPIASGDKGLAVRAVEDALVNAGLTVKMPNSKYDNDLKAAVERLHTCLVNRGDDRASLFADSERLSVEAQDALRGDLLGYHADVDRDSTSESEVLRVQRRLHTLYYLSRDSIDGKFGEKSVEALRAFQSENGIPETDVANANTQALLFSDRAAAKPLPYRVEVSLANQRVTVFKRDDQGNYEKVRSFVCSTGLNNSTPRGIFLDGYPANRWHYFKKFKCWAQYSFEIEGDILFHSVIYSSNNEHSVRSSSVYNLGSPASHGCIRLQVKDARWLFQNCPRHSLVIVIY